MSDLTLDSFAVLIVFGSLETSVLIITATIPALRPLFQKKRAMHGSSSHLNKMPSDPSRRIQSNSHASQAKTYSLNTIQSTPTPDQDQRVHDDEVFLVPFTPKVIRTAISAA